MDSTSPTSGGEGAPGRIRRGLAHRSVVETFMARHGTLRERTAPYVAVYGSMAAIFVMVPLLSMTLGPIGLGAALSIPVLLLVRYERIYRSARRRLAEGRLCLACGYSLRGSGAGPDGSGTCPECGASFDGSTYA